jgi:hypothetical protein
MRTSSFVPEKRASPTKASVYPSRPSGMMPNPDRSILSSAGREVCDAVAVGVLEHHGSGRGPGGPEPEHVGAGAAGRHVLAAPAVDGVVAGPAAQEVRADAAFDHVVAGEAEQNVVLGRAVEPVVARRA